MIKCFFFLLALICLASPVQAIVGDISHNKFTSNNTYTHTPIELKPISMNPLRSFQVVSVCFLGSGVGCGEASFTTGDDDYTTDTSQKCIETGYNHTSCTIPFYFKHKCPFNSKYMACFEDTERACEELGYFTACSEGEVKDPELVCEYNSEYFGCTCAPCDGYTYSYSEATSAGYEPDGMCQSCDMKRYKRKAKSCAGFLTCECGGEIGTETCKSGTVTKYKTCKECCANECTETTEPPTGTNYRYEACSKKYCITGCAANYTDWCTQPTTNCTEMGYNSTSSCANGGVKCPYGNYWHCY